jgi:uncharacterized Zn ribbon protein
MNLCSHNHEEVCYDDRKKCPVCEKMDEWADYEKSATEEIKDLKGQIADLEDKLNTPVIREIYAAQVSVIQ